MEVSLICLAAFSAAILTFFSGFGLGTILTPVFLIFFPVEMAIALTAVVHFFNNIFKLSLVARYADRIVLFRFGVPAVVFAFAGAWLLLQIPGHTSLFEYQLFGRYFEVYPVELIIALLLFAFAILDIIPAMNRLEFSPDKLPLGGMLSGFFGGLSGHQGALRTAFLIRAGLSKEAFIGTAVVVSTAVDISRLGVYSTRFMSAGMLDHTPLILAAIISAISGAYIGNILFKKVTLGFIQKFVALLLIALSLALGLGWL